MMRFRDDIEELTQTVLRGLQAPGRRRRRRADDAYRPRRSTRDGPFRTRHAQRSFFEASRSSLPRYSARGVLHPSSTDGKIIDTAIINGPDPDGAFNEHVELLEWAVEELKPGATVFGLGTLDGEPIVGSALSGIGIVKIGRDTFVIKLDPDDAANKSDLSLGQLDTEQIIGMFGDPD